ncbi:Gfo/Idh/MocA family oxidoreductase [Jiangella aurantiaca]|uniref:Gfo/Idh/MocA family oxidoreductase n=1 Tax=Jiangella aurantiaca TaxID=2530373 RepID=A0A4R5A612_9ACTN|nr:Gfo/Idh/MocA family oxidoreductase [Jiangella aurantiaca]TDD66510.1 Gfo/Idh/MocA family oxidoreductase [Jiangella aurantiaca]
MTRFRVALAGAGHWHTGMHVRGFAAASALVTAVCEPHDRAAAERWARELDCPVYPTVDDLLEAGGFDVVWAMPRHAEAAALAERLVEAGIPFAIEKPSGLDSVQIEPLVSLVERAGAFGAVAFINRYGPFWEELRALRTAGHLSTVVHGHFRVINGAPVRYVHEGVPWMLQAEVSGGGALRNLGSHGADAICELTGGDPVVLAAATSSGLYRGEVEDYAAALVRGVDGGIFGLEAGYTHGHIDASDQEFRVAGPGAYIVERRSDVVVATSSGERVRRGLSISERYVRFVVDTLDRLRTGRPPIASIADCWRAMRLIDHIYLSAETSAGTSAGLSPGAGR